MELIFLRMRKRAHLPERIASCGGLIVNTAEEIAGFSEGKRLQLEIGCGKGRFITETASLNPKIPYLAVEQCENVAILAAEKAVQKKLSNIKFFMKNISSLDSLLPDGSVERIYLNFSDPWPKKKQAKRRLTHPVFLALYKRWLCDGGEIFFKTDNAKLFEYSLNSFCSEDFILSNITFDLANSGFEGNIMTEYESRFTKENKPIYRLEARTR